MAYFDIEAAESELYTSERRPVDLEVPLQHYFSRLALGEEVSLGQVCLEDAARLEEKDPLAAAVYERVARHSKNLT